MSRFCVEKWPYFKWIILMNRREQVAYWGGAVLVALFASAIIANTTMMQPNMGTGGLRISDIQGNAVRRPLRALPINGTHVRVRVPEEGMADARIQRTASISPANGGYSELIARVQRKLKRLGYDPGPIDGQLGPSTRAALRKFQRANNMPPTGQIEPGVLALLLP